MFLIDWIVTSQNDSPKINYSLKMFSNIFITELEYYPTIHRRTPKIKSPSRHRNQTSFKLFLFSSFLVHVASRRRHAQLATNAANPAGITFSFSPFSSFSHSLLFFFPFLFPFSFLPSSPSCSLLTHAPPPVPCAALQHTPVPCPRAAGCSARRSASARAVPSLVLLPQSTPEGYLTTGRVVLPSVEAVDALCGGRRAQCTAEIFLPCEPSLAPYKSS